MSRREARLKAFPIQLFFFWTASLLFIRFFFSFSLSFCFLIHRFSVCFHFSLGCFLFFLFAFMLFPSSRAKGSVALGTQTFVSMLFGKTRQCFSKKTEMLFPLLASRLPSPLSPFSPFSPFSPRRLREDRTRWKQKAFRFSPGRDD